MRLLFEELSAAQRVGGVETVCAGLARRILNHEHELVRVDSARSLPERWRPELVHIHGLWSPALIARWCRWRAGNVPCMVTIHGMLEPWALAHKKWKKRLGWLIYQRRALNSAKLLHATSEREVSNLHNLGLHPPVALIPWGIETVATVADSGKLKDFGGLDRIALFVGRLYPVKGLPLLLEAWSRIRPPGWKLRLVGPDEAGHRLELEHLVKQLCLTESVSFTGPLSGDALTQEYRDASLFVLPSKTENFGITVGDALAHGLPALTTQGAPWRILEEENCGWWVPANAEGLASALQDATSCPASGLVAMGERGRLLVERDYGWERVAKQMIDCYRWILEDDSKPTCVC